MRRLNWLSVHICTLLAILVASNTYAAPVNIDYTATASGNGSTPVSVANDRAYGSGYVYWNTVPGATYGDNSWGAAAAKVTQNTANTDLVFDLWMLPGYAQMPDDPMNPFPGPPMTQDLPAGADAQIEGTLTFAAPSTVNITVPTSISASGNLAWSCTIKRGSTIIANVGNTMGYTDQFDVAAGEIVNIYTTASTMSRSADATDKLVVRLDATAVPEPGAILLMGAGCALMGFKRFFK